MPYLRPPIAPDGSAWWATFMARTRHSQIDDVEERPGGYRLDIALATLLLAGTAFCWSLPHALGISDEGLFLYEAKRVAEGAVLYRDILS